MALNLSSSSSVGLQRASSAHQTMAARCCGEPHHFGMGGEGLAAGSISSVREGATGGTFKQMTANTPDTLSCDWRSTPNQTPSTSIHHRRGWSGGPVAKQPKNPQLFKSFGLGLILVLLFLHKQLQSRASLMSAKIAKPPPCEKACSQPDSAKHWCKVLWPSRPSRPSRWRASPAAPP